MSKSRATRVQCVTSSMADTSALWGNTFGIKDPEAFTRNITRALEEAGQALSAYFKPRDGAPADLNLGQNLAEVIGTLNTVGAYWTSDPTRLLQAQQRLATAYFGLWMYAVQRLAGLPAAPLAEPALGDKRFTDAEWTGNLVFDVIKQFYLVTARCAQDMVNEADVDEHTRQK